MRKFNILNRLSAVLTMLACTFVMLASSFPCITADAAISDTGSNDLTGFPTSDTLIAKAAELLGAKYTFGQKGYYGPYNPGNYDSMSTAQIHRSGIDCSGLIYYTLTSLGYSTDGFVYENPVPVDTDHWLNHGYTAYINYDKKHEKIRFDKLNVSDTIANYWEMTDDDGNIIGTIDRGSIVIAEKPGEINHCWIYLGEFDNRDAVISYLKDIGVDSSLLTEKTVYSVGNSKHWRIESSGDNNNEGVVVNNGTEGKRAGSQNITTFPVTDEDKGGVVVKKYAVDGDNSRYIATYSNNKVVNTQTRYTVKDSDGNYVVSSKDATGVYTYSGKSSTAYTYQLSKAGTFNIADIPVGNYTIYETVYAEGYAPPTTVTYRFTVETAETSYVEIQNAQQTGSYVITKVAEETTGIKYVASAENNEALNNAVRFTLQTSDGKYVTGVEKSYDGTYTYGGMSPEPYEFSLGATGNWAGKISISQLPVGEYTLIETKTAEGYHLADPIKFKITFTNQSVESVVNSEEWGTVVVLKVAENSTNPDHITGIRFVLKGTSATGREIELEGFTDSNGEVRFEKVPVGKYTLIEDETTVTVGYITATEQEVVVKYDEEFKIEVLNKSTKTKVSKQDITTGEELPGATLSIIDKESGETIATWVSTTTPYYLEGVLAAGKTYILHEEIAPEGYLLANDVEFTVSEDGTIDEVEMYDDLIRGSITLTKVDEDYPDNKLTGAEFTVYNDVDADGVYNADIDTEYGKLIEDDGTYSLSEIPYGKYLVHEETAPAGFVKDDNYYAVSIEEDGKVYTVETSAGIGFINTEMKGTIEVQKTTEGMVNLEGITLILEGESAYGNPVYIEATTDVDGIAVFENVPVGTYTITEDGESVPYGYLTAEPTSVTVEYAEVTDVVIYNTEQSGTIEVQKTTEGMVNLEGITLILEGTSDTGRAIRIESTTDANGLATFENVPVGTYTITEDGESVPYGYLTAEPTSVTVEYTEVTDVVIYNTEQSGSIVINKSTVDNNDEAIDDITFILEGVSDTGRYIRREAITNDDGVATFENIPVGVYTIKEDGSTVPMGYLTAEPTSVTVEYAKATNVSVVNELMDLGDDRPNDTPQTSDKMPSPIVAVSFAGLLCAAALISRKKYERE